LKIKEYYIPYERTKIVLVRRGSIMPENRGCGCGCGFGGDNCIWIIIIILVLFCCCGNNNGGGCC
jgi:hypothetical protein